MMKLLDRFSVLLLDMNGTFMFGEDRFGVSENFYATYQTFGGDALSSEQIQAAIQDCYKAMLAISRSPQNFDNFPSLRESLRRFSGVPEVEISFLEKVFATHECGTIPPEYAALLRRLSKTHQLGLVSNIWSPKESWLAEFERAEISDVFTCKIFSSDCRSIKPSPVLFQQALKNFPADASVLFVGDSLHRDIIPAKALGLATAWINSRRDRSPNADYILSNLLAIET